MKTWGDTEFEITELLDGMPIMVYQVEMGEGQYRLLPGVVVDDIGNLSLNRPGLGISIGDHDYEENDQSWSWAALRKQGLINELADVRDGNKQIVLAGVLCGKGISCNPHKDHWPQTFRAFHL
jgi:hypothetical protein